MSKRSLRNGVRFKRSLPIASEWGMFQAIATDRFKVGIVCVNRNTVEAIASKEKEKDKEKDKDKEKEREREKEKEKDTASACGRRFDPPPFGG